MVRMYMLISVGWWNSIGRFFSELECLFGRVGSSFMRQVRVVNVLRLIVRKVICQLKYWLIMCLIGILNIIVSVVLVVIRFSVCVCLFGGVMWMVSVDVIDQNIVCVKVILMWLIISMLKFQVKNDRMWLVINRINRLISRCWCFILLVSSINGSDINVIIYVQMVSIMFIWVVFMLKLLVIFDNRLIGVNFVVLKINVVMVNVMICSYVILCEIVFVVISFGLVIQGKM